MKKFYIVIWLMVFMCGGCAVTEVLTGVGSVAGLCLVITGLTIIVYITKLPEEASRGD